MSLGAPRPLSVAMDVATDFIQRFAPDTQVAGSIRRGAPEVRDIDLMTKERLGDIKSRLDAAGIQVLRSGDKTLYCTYRDFTINLYWYEDEYAGAMLFYLTGPSGYTVGYRLKAKRLGWVLNQYGLFNEHGHRVAGETEEGIYAALGKTWKEPHLRGK